MKENEVAEWCRVEIVRPSRLLECSGRRARCGAKCVCVCVCEWVGGWLSVRARTDQIDKVYNRRYTTTRKWYDKEALNLYDWQSRLLRIWLRGPSQSRFPTTNGLCVCVFVCMYMCLLARLFVCSFVCLSMSSIENAITFRTGLVRSVSLRPSFSSLCRKIQLISSNRCFLPSHPPIQIHLPNFQFNSSLDF